jgi:tetratricopeptide (TPR) repeat protein
MAGLAFAISFNLDPKTYGAELVHDFQARAAAESANALRAADLLVEAEGQFASAFELAEKGTGSQWLRAHLLSLVASLHAAQRRWSLSFSALDAAKKLLAQLEDRHSIGRVQLKRALYQSNDGRPEEALATNTEALRLIDAKFDPKLALKAKYNQILFLADCGKYREAERAIFEGRREFEASLGHVEKIRLKWLEGRIDAGLERFPSAERRLTEARDAFAELGMKFAAVLTSLELAHVCLRQKRVGQATEHALDAETVFRQLDIRREQIVAVATLAECFRQRVATPTLVQDVIAFVQRAEHHPGEEFEIRRA